MKLCKSFDIRVLEMIYQPVESGGNL